MKAPILVAAVVGCTLSAPVLSTQEPVAPGKPAMSMGMDKQMPQMQESMRTMQRQMEQFRATTDPTERQKLTQEHMQAIQENMQAMSSLDGPMMVPHAMMEKRVDMMQMMMEQLMQHHQALESMLAT